jgi:predicted unusual protein kinase regulating ubiquinone biosynthesis (AarF/ABC1/UbiB family)
MTTFEQKVKDICDEAYNKNLQQITIDLIQDNIEGELLNSDEPVTRDAVGAAAYDTDILLEVFNPKFDKDIDLLTRLKKALDEWSDDIENTNKILGIPIQG